MMKEYLSLYQALHIITGFSIYVVLVWSMNVLDARQSCHIAPVWRSFSDVMGGFVLDIQED
jgi:hypothetical protein